MNLFYTGVRFVMLRQQIPTVITGLAVLVMTMMV
jgi:hypothetical protein